MKIPLCLSFSGDKISVSRGDERKQRLNAKEEIKMDHFEMVEKLRQKANVSYEEAKAALEDSDWDILDALVLLESEGKMKENDARAAESAAQENKSYDYTTKKGNQVHVDVSSGWTKLWDFVKKMFQKGNTNQFVIHRNGQELLSMPITVLAILALVMWPASVIILFIALFFGARYSFRGPDIGSKVNSAMDKAANMVQGDQENKVE